MGCCKSLSPLMPVENALEHMLLQINPVTETQTVNLQEALGRVLATDIKSPLTLPLWDNSAMDGYALRSQDCQGNGPWRLPVSSRVAAGDAVSQLAAISAARIFTGAPIPSGADCVIMQEDCSASHGWVTINKKPVIGSNIRRCGEDIHTNDVILSAGTRLTPADISVLAGVGIATVCVHRRVRVALLATGNELVTPGDTLKPGQIYNSNRYLLRALLTALNIEIIDGGIVQDDFTKTKTALEQAAAQADCIITTGGVSVGDEDHVKSAVAHLGNIDLWKLSIKPGKPLAFGHVRHTPFIGLPGNPAAVLVTFCAVARAFLLKLTGSTRVHYTRVYMPAGFNRKANTRQEFLRVRINSNQAGAQWLEEHPNQGSHLLSSAAWADGLAITTINQPIKQGDLLPFVTFNELFH